MKVFKDIFSPPDYAQRLKRQKDEAREQHLEHSAAAELHKGLAEMYAQRYKRLLDLELERLREV